MSERKSVAVKKVGAFIEPLLKTNDTGKVIGITSKGIFLLFNQKVIFLTSETIRNPFMLHVPDPADFPPGIALKQKVTLEDHKLWSENRVYDFDTVTEIVPRPLNKAKQAIARERSYPKIVELFHGLNLSRHQDSFIYIADALLNNKMPQDSLQLQIIQTVERLRHGMHDHQLEECEAAMSTLAGNGKGLTPSGDDFLSGFFLIKNCLYDEADPEGKFIGRLNELAVEMMRNRSTWISANLLEAATQRLVDERVGLAAQVLLGQCRMDAVMISTKLETFGNSSGIDSFTGMVAALCRV